MKKDVFVKFFSILKLAGWGYIKVNHKEIIEMQYTLDKCPFLSLTLETAARTIWNFINFQRKLIKIHN